MNVNFNKKSYTVHGAVIALVVLIAIALVVWATVGFIAFGEAFTGSRWPGILIVISTVTVTVDGKEYKLLPEPLRKYISYTSLGIGLLYSIYLLFV